MRQKIYYLLILFGFLIIHSANAGQSGLGDVALNLMEPVTVLSNFVGSAAIVIGFSCLFASFVKYMQHRVSPLMVPISTVVVLLLIGIILILLPLTYKLTESGVPYHYFYKTKENLHRSTILNKHER